MLKQKKMEYESEKGIPFPDLITLSDSEIFDTAATLIRVIGSRQP